MFELNLQLKWLAEVHRHLLRGKQVLLHGNVHDVFQHGGKDMTLPDIIKQYLTDDGFQAVIQYDLVDGGKLDESAIGDQLRSLLPEERKTTNSRKVTNEQVSTAETLSLIHI